MLLYIVRVSDQPAIRLSVRWNNFGQQKRKKLILTSNVASLTPLYQDALFPDRLWSTPKKL